MNGEDQNLSSMSMSDLFRQEVAAQTALLTDALLALEHRPADKKQLEALMRAAHSIKGAARIVQACALAAQCEALEHACARRDERPLIEVEVKSLEKLMLELERILQVQLHKLDSP